MGARIVLAVLSGLMALALLAPAASAAPRCIVVRMYYLPPRYICLLP
jgi:hypothetical protein